jgi:hypothetical protein
MASNKAAALCSQLVATIKAACAPDMVHPHKRIKGLSGSTAPTASPTITRLLSPTRKPLSTKKRVSLQSPQCTPLQREELSLSDELVSMWLSSASGSWVSSATSEKSDGKVDNFSPPSALRHLLLGRVALLHRAGGGIITWLLGLLHMGKLSLW